MHLLSQKSVFFNKNSKTKKKKQLERWKNWKMKTTKHALEASRFLGRVAFRLNLQPTEQKQQPNANWTLKRLKKKQIYIKQISKTRYQREILPPRRVLSGRLWPRKNCTWGSEIRAHLNETKECQHSKPVWKLLLRCVKTSITVIIEITTQYMSYQKTKRTYYVIWSHEPGVILNQHFAHGETQGRERFSFWKDHRNCSDQTVIISLLYIKVRILVFHCKRSTSWGALNARTNTHSKNQPICERDNLQ